MMWNHKGVLGCIREACSGPQLAGRRQARGKGSWRMSADRCKRRWCGIGAGSAAEPGGLSDCSRIAARGHGDAKDRVGALVPQPSPESAGRSRTQGPARFGPTPQTAAARARPPALTAARARRPGGRTPWLPAACPCVCLTVPRVPRPSLLHRHHRSSAAGGSEPDLTPPRK